MRVQSTNHIWNHYKDKITYLHPREEKKKLFTCFAASKAALDSRLIAANCPP